MAEEAKLPRTTTIYMTDEDHRIAAILREQTGLTQSGLVRHLMQKALNGEEGSHRQEIREHVSALAKLIL